jgi:hypothetical protein
MAIVTVQVNSAFRVRRLNSLWNWRATRRLRLASALMVVVMIGSFG